MFLGLDAFPNLMVKLLYTSSSSFFSTRRNLIPSIAYLQYSNLDSVERICLVVGLQRFSFDTVLITVPPMPSHGCFSWLIAKSILHWAQNLFGGCTNWQSSYNSSISLHNHNFFHVVKVCFIFNVVKIAFITSIFLLKCYIMWVVTRHNAETFTLHCIFKLKIEYHWM